jgi:hypothetical protein
MIDPDKIFSLFKDDPTVEDLKQQPIYWLKLYKKLYNNYQYLSDNNFKIFNLGDNVNEVNFEALIWDVLFNYLENIKDIGVWDKSQIQYVMDDELTTILLLHNQFYLDKEEYEKCAVIKNIMDASQGI